LVACACFGDFFGDANSSHYTDELNRVFKKTQEYFVVHRNVRRFSLKEDKAKVQQAWDATPRRGGDRRAAPGRERGRWVFRCDAVPDAVCRLPIRSAAPAASPGPSDLTDSFVYRDRHSGTCAGHLQVSRRALPTRAWDFWMEPRHA
jgi:hypothetical protein